MDLLIKLNDTKVKIRVAGLVRTPRGYLFEKSDKGYIFALGGKIMLNESSREAMIREIVEEIGMKAEDLTLRSVIESFYSTAVEKVHEICFVFEVGDIFTGSVPDEFIEVPVDKLSEYEVRPNQIIDILRGDNLSLNYIISN